MEAYFAFTDECGSYNKIRTDSFNKTHPFYVRSTVIISFDDYMKLQKGIEEIKQSFDIDKSIEIKWSHYGSALKKNYTKIPHLLTSNQLEEYYKKSISLLGTLPSATVYYTLTENSSIGRVDEIALLKMHLQNALQRIQKIVSENDGFAIVVADDLNDKTKALKKAIYALTMAGDYYVQYKNIKTGLYIDFSDQCPGLQMADICAGIFTASLKFECASNEEKHKYAYAHTLFFSEGYKKVRNSFIQSYYTVYKAGIKEVPNGAGNKIAIDISQRIEQQLQDDLIKEIMNN